MFEIHQCRCHWCCHWREDNFLLVRHLTQGTLLPSRTVNHHVNSLSFMWSSLCKLLSVRLYLISWSTTALTLYSIVFWWTGKWCWGIATETKDDDLIQGLTFIQLVTSFQRPQPKRTHAFSKRRCSFDDHWPLADIIFTCSGWVARDGAPTTIVPVGLCDGKDVRFCLY